MKTMKFKKKHLKIPALAAIAKVFFTGSPVYASISGSPIAQGTQRLISDLSTWLMVLAPVVAGALIIYFFIRRSAADEMDTRKWNSRITTAIISCVGAVLGSVLLNLIIGYYMGSV